MWTMTEIGAAARFVPLVVALAALAAGHGSTLRAQQDPGAGRREHMREMMRGLVPPPGMTPAALPAPDSDGARLLVRYCTQCHDLPSPRYKTAEQWPLVLERMLARMEAMAPGGMMGRGMMGGAPVQVPPLDALNALLAYVQGNALQQVRPEELTAGERGDRVAYLTACTRCHAAPSPALHPPEAWAGIVARMQGNMALMNRPPLAPEERAAIVRFLQASAAGSRP